MLISNFVFFFMFLKSAFILCQLKKIGIALIMYFVKRVNFDDPSNEKIYQYISFIQGLSKFMFFSKYVRRFIPNFLIQSRWMLSGSYSKISSLAQLHYIVKFQKYWKKSTKLLIFVRYNQMRKVCSTTFLIATGTSETLKTKNLKKIDKLKSYVQLKLAGFC